MSTPVVLVHGYLASALFMIPMRERLQRRGHGVHLVDLPPLAIQDLATLSNSLAWNVERVLRRTGATQVDLVGVSLGGILALHYAQRAAHLHQVRNLVAVGAPFHGSPFARYGRPLLGWLSAGIHDMRPGAPALQAMLDQGLPADVSMTSIALKGDLAAPPASCTFPGAHQVLLRGFPSPVSHQWLVASGAAIDAIDAALSGRH